jgi:hypothetical protein
MKREVIDCARCLTRFFSTLFPILVLFATALASANDSDPRARTVTQFMRDQQVLGRGGGDGMLMYRLISREFILKNNIDPQFTRLNSYYFSSFRVIAVNGTYVDVSIRNDKCQICPMFDKTLRFAVIQEGSKFVILPPGYRRGSDYLDPWWQVIDGRYELPLDSRRQ